MPAVRTRGTAAFTLAALLTSIVVLTVGPAGPASQPIASTRRQRSSRINTGRLRCR